jgi:ribosomal protein L37E
MPVNLILSRVFSAMLLVLAAFSLIYGIRLFVRRESTPGPKRGQQIVRIALGPMVLSAVLILAMGQIRPDLRMTSVLLAIPVIVFSLRFAYVLWHEPTEDDAIASFAEDREHCGRCGYSVIANATGRCSECGWDFPTGTLRIEDREWTAWWKKWRIGYMRHHRWHLFSYIGLGLYFFFIAAVFWSQDKRPQAFVLSLVGVHNLVNGIRVIEYFCRRDA